MDPADVLGEGQLFWENKCTLADSVLPQCKILATRLFRRRSEAAP